MVEPLFLTISLGLQAQHSLKLISSKNPKHQLILKTGKSIVLKYYKQSDGTVNSPDMLTKQKKKSTSGRIFVIGDSTPTLKKNYRENKLLLPMKILSGFKRSLPENM